MLKKNNLILNEVNIIKAIKFSGIKKGSSVFLTTSLGMFGLNKNKNLNQLFLKCIKKIIGPKGNIFVPTYSYSFSDKRLKIFDLDTYIVFDKSEYKRFPSSQIK